ncbi:MAG: alpha/beta fold hydrolase [Paracoccaceae bacterium]|nr:MAG: alpha/beta fold hydrolase [Paracoccaceae bacterium]
MPPDWPHRSLSHQVGATLHRWHVQIAGDGPVLLLLHGAGGAAMSWRGLLPILAGRFRVIAPDLPGQGFSRSGRSDRYGMDAMAQDLAALCDRLGSPPAAIVGHSAGAALALRMAEARPCPVVGINAALGTFQGLAGVMFPALARAFSAAPFLPQVVSSLAATPARIAALLAATGSRIDDDGADLYRRLVARPAHVEGTLAMMAAWRLEPLLARLHALRFPVLLVAGGNDRTVPAEISARAARGIPGAAHALLPGLGHLAQEEAPEAVAAAIMPFLAQAAAPQDRPHPRHA